MSSVLDMLKGERDRLVAEHRRLTEERDALTLDLINLDAAIGVLEGRLVAAEPPKTEPAQTSLKLANGLTNEPVVKHRPSGPAPRKLTQRRPYSRKVPPKRRSITPHYTEDYAPRPQSIRSAALQVIQAVGPCTADEASEYLKPAYHKVQVYRALWAMSQPGLGGPLQRLVADGAPTVFALHSKEA